MLLPREQSYNLCILQNVPGVRDAFGVQEQLLAGGLGIGGIGGKSAGHQFDLAVQIGRQAMDRADEGVLAAADHPITKFTFFCRHILQINCWSMDDYSERWESMQMGGQGQGGMRWGEMRSRKFWTELTKFAEIYSLGG